MNKIIVMDEVLANQIAAGEVVERPSSVVKELVENSIDAGASHIEIRSTGGGKLSIVVKDDGSGMEREDALLSLKRHASSKIKGQYDLFRIKTLGFRGEAIPSIASVSEMEILTGTGEGAGTRVIVNSFGEGEASDYQSKLGTTIAVNNLFYNTPARLKYLKTNSIENSSTTEVVQRLALGFPHVAFDFYLEDKKIFTTSGKENLLETIAQIFGVAVSKNMRQLEMEEDSFSINGYIGTPEISKASRYYVITFLNSRSVYLGKVHKAIADAYKDFLPIGRFPFVILNISLDYSLVDVNVHPSKREVRLSMETTIMEALRKKIRESFMENKPHFSIDNLYKEVEVAPKVTDYSANLFLDDEVNNTFPEFRQPQRDYQANTDLFSYIEEEVAIQVDTSLFSPLENKIFNLQAVGQVLETYIVATSNTDVYLVDQHAANERINFEYFEERYFEEYTLISPLLPFVIDVAPEFVVKIDEQHLQILQHIGIIAESFGSNSIIIREYPSFFDFSSDVNLMRDLLENVLRDEKADLLDVKRYAIASIACKASIKANNFMSLSEQNKLLENLLKCKNPANCPHGRPTMIKITKYEIEKMFKRKQ